MTILGVPYYDYDIKGPKTLGLGFRVLGFRVLAGPAKS